MKENTYAITEDQVKTKIMKVLNVLSGRHVSRCLMELDEVQETHYKSVYVISIQDGYAYSSRELTHFYGDTFIATYLGATCYCLFDIQDIFDIQSGHKRVHYFRLTSAKLSKEDKQFIVSHLLKTNSHAEFDGSYVYIDGIQYQCLDTKKFYVISNMIINNILIRKDNEPYKISHGFYDVIFV